MYYALFYKPVVNIELDWKKEQSKKFPIFLREHQSPQKVELNLFDMKSIADFLT